jgi:hypothetical protein
VLVSGDLLSAAWKFKWIFTQAKKQEKQRSQNKKPKAEAPTTNNNNSRKAICSMASIDA